MAASSASLIKAESILNLALQDVGPAFSEPIGILTARINALIRAPRFAMFVVLGRWEAASLVDHPVFRARLRNWVGVEMFLQSWQYPEEIRLAPPLDRLRPRPMTAGAGELLALSAAEAERRMREGRDVVEQATGRAVNGFIAPAWVHDHGARSAMRAVGFGIAEYSLHVWRSGKDKVLALGSVIPWASHSRARTASSLGVAAIPRASFGRMSTVRLAVHPGDVVKRTLLARCGRTIRSLPQKRVVGRYSDLLGVEAAAR